MLSTGTHTPSLLLLPSLSTQRCNTNQLAPRHAGRRTWPRRGPVPVAALGNPELGNLVAQAITTTASATGAESLVATLTAETVPGPLRIIASDVASVATLTPTLPGLGRLGLLWYSLFGRPAPVFGLLDFYVTGPLSENMGSKYVVDCIQCWSVFFVVVGKVLDLLF